MNQSESFMEQIISFVFRVLYKLNKKRNNGFDNVHHIINLCHKEWVDSFIISIPKYDVLATFFFKAEIRCNFRQFFFFNENESWQCGVSRTHQHYPLICFSELKELNPSSQISAILRYINRRSIRKFLESGISRVGNLFTRWFSGVNRFRCDHQDQDSPQKIDLILRSKWKLVSFLLVW